MASDYSHEIEFVSQLTTPTLVVLPRIGKSVSGGPETLAYFTALHDEILSSGEAAYHREFWQSRLLMDESAALRGSDPGGTDQRHRPCELIEHQPRAVSFLHDVAPEDTTTKITNGAVLCSQRQLGTTKTWHDSCHDTWHDTEGKLIYPYTLQAIHDYLTSARFTHSTSGCSLGNGR